MDDREKLVELIGKISCRYAPCDQECGECTNAELFDEDIEMIADHLLSHGVTFANDINVLTNCGAPMKGESK